MELLQKKDGDKYKVLPPKDGKSADANMLGFTLLRDFDLNTSDNISRVEIDQTQGDGLKLKMDQELKQFAFTSHPNVNSFSRRTKQISFNYVSITLIKQQASKWVVDYGN